MVTTLLLQEKVLAPESLLATLELQVELLIAVVLPAFSVQVGKIPVPLARLERLQLAERVVVRARALQEATSQAHRVSLVLPDITALKTTNPSALLIMSPLQELLIVVLLAPVGTIKVLPFATGVIHPTIVLGVRKKHVLQGQGPYQPWLVVRVLATPTIEIAIADIIRLIRLCGLIALIFRPMVLTLIPTILAKKN